MLTEHGERKIDRFFWLLIAVAVLYLIGHLVVAFTREAFETPSIPLRPIPASAPAAADYAEPITSTPSTSVKAAARRSVVTSSTFDLLADCESGEWDRNGNPIPGTARWDDQRGDYEGGLHFAPSTWARAGGLRYAPHAYLATRVEQIEIAEAWLARTSWRQWPVCSRKIGVR